MGNPICASKRAVGVAAAVLLRHDLDATWLHVRARHVRPRLARMATTRNQMQNHCICLPQSRGRRQAPKTCKPNEEGPSLWGATRAS